MIMFSIVCAYNDKNILNECLLNSLKRQTIEYELHTVDNTKQQFSSAANALNHGAVKANGDYIMFVHQDIILENDDWLKDVERTLQKIHGLGVAGVAGRQEKSRDNTASVTHGIPAKFVGKRRIKSPAQVQTLDECLVIIKRKLFNSLKFDSTTCNDWHMYAVDLCLNAQNAGYKNYVIPSSTYHKSLGRSPKSVFAILSGIGSLPEGYVRTAPRVLAKHRSHYKAIYTVCGTWRTCWPFMFQRIINIPKDIARHLYWKFRQRKTQSH